MRSGKIMTRKISAVEVSSHAKKWIKPHLKLQDAGPKCTASVVLGLLLIAASKLSSIFAACRDLANAPSDQAIRNALIKQLPEMKELERRLNAALATPVPKIVFRRRRDAAIDLTLIPYHGRPNLDPRELYHSLAKSGTTKFHAYATLYVIHEGQRYTLAVTRVDKGEKMPEVTKRLLRMARARGLKLRVLLLDRGFFSTEVIDYLKHSRTPFLMPVMFRGRKPTQPAKLAASLHQFLTKMSGWHRFTLSGKGGNQKVSICVSAMFYLHEKTQKKRLKRMVFACWEPPASRVLRRLSPACVREWYRRRFAIESSYRQVHQARVRTCTRCPKLRFLFFALALILRNVWVWLHYFIFADERGETPSLRLELLRFRRMLEWLASVESDKLHDGTPPSIEWSPSTP
jgi:putative transposase